MCAWQVARAHTHTQTVNFLIGFQEILHKLHNFQMACFVCYSSSESTNSSSQL